MMQRRTFIRALAAGVVGGMATTPASAVERMVPLPRARKTVLQPRVWQKISQASMDEQQVQQAVERIRNFNQPHRGDTVLPWAKVRLLKKVNRRFTRLEQWVGHANFHLLGFDEALKISRNSSRVGAFTKQELDFLEELFHHDASDYGFLGHKPFSQLTDEVPRKEVSKQPYTGNFLYRGDPVRMYNRIRRDVGDKVVLTSGVRSVIKQFRLFLAKAEESGGNLSMASRSLAPPGYSFHGIGDFDVGQVGYGAYNFTARFATTEVFRRLRDLGYVDLRYPEDNLLGVRFEPWHVKVRST
uniref:D-alanyl-D-alanine carboxypeptidase-like core domain-containing protein n=1 Tax=Magnetococcus massalia (strain MO-1) TaxID=451514 RepID=A0A1S7LPE8_MAGMO|nr:Conserved protein of unknown function. Containing twin-arginine translocation pathway, signal sequence domain, peptidase M15B and M15C domain and D, D-carboxypeptidase VanY/endolysins [Candidatus Magnetococcus massalia]